MKRFVSSASVLLFLAGCGAAPTAGSIAPQATSTSIEAQRSMKPVMSAKEEAKAKALLEKTFEKSTPDYSTEITGVSFNATPVVGVFQFHLTLRSYGFGGPTRTSEVDGVVNLTTGAVSRPREGGTPTGDVLRPQDITAATAFVKKALEIRAMDNMHTLVSATFNRTATPGVLEFSAEMVSYDFAGRKHEYQVEGTVSLESGKVTKSR